MFRGAVTTERRESVELVRGRGPGAAAGGDDRDEAAASANLERRPAGEVEVLGTGDVVGEREARVPDVRADAARRA